MDAKGAPYVVDVAVYVVHHFTLRRVLQKSQSLEMVWMFRLYYLCTLSMFVREKEREIERERERGSVFMSLDSFEILE